MKPNVLIQLDPDPHASTFDSMVAIDSGVDHLLCHSRVGMDDVQGLVHGAMFTRGGDSLKHTALFFGGSDVGATEALVSAAKACFFGPVRVSLMSDPNGSNTTAAAAVLCIQRHLSLKGRSILILGGTGPVGQRIARILVSLGDEAPSQIRLASRQLANAKRVCEQIGSEQLSSALIPIAVPDMDAAMPQISDCDVIVAAGAAGVRLLEDGWEQATSARVVIDLNAVPPAGIANVGVTDSAMTRGTAVCYGAIGVGNLKMKIHKAAVKQLFESNDQVLETEAIYQLGCQLGISGT